MPFIPPPGAQYLGEAVLGSSNANLGPVIFGPGWGFLFVEHFIAGYTGTDIALLRLGTGTTVDTGTNYSFISSHWVTGTTAQSSSPLSAQTGIRVANDGTTNSRRGHHDIFNGSGTNRNKFVDSRTITYAGTGATAATTVSSQSLVTGTWFNTAQAQCVGLNGGTGGNSLTAGSFIVVYGIPGTG